MQNIYMIESGEVKEITIDEAIATQNRNDYGHDVITAYCDSADEALALAELYDAGDITYSNIPGQLAIAYGLVGLTQQS